MYGALFRFLLLPEILRRGFVLLGFFVPSNIQFHFVPVLLAATSTDYIVPSSFLCAPARFSNSGSRRSGLPWIRAAGLRGLHSGGEQRTAFIIPRAGCSRTLKLHGGDDLAIDAGIVCS